MLLFTADSQDLRLDAQRQLKAVCIKNFLKCFLSHPLKYIYNFIFQLFVWRNLVWYLFIKQQYQYCGFGVPVSLSTGLCASAYAGQAINVAVHGYQYKSGVHWKQ